MAKLIGIAIRPKASRDIVELDQVQIYSDTGVEGDKRNRPGKRQVTLMSATAWAQTCLEIGETLPWTTRRANLLVDDLPLEKSKGQYIVIGDVVLEITGETDPCKLMEEAYNGLYNALKTEWRGGVTCRVIHGGQVKTGIKASLKPAPAR